MNHPSYDDVTRYANKRRLEGFPPIDARKFWAHYEAVGWRRNGQAIEKWKVVFRMWEMESELPELPADRFRRRDKLFARYCLVWGKGVPARPEARDWSDERCQYEYRKAIDDASQQTQGERV